MKKFILLTFACFLFAGSQLSFAQTEMDYPKQKTVEITNMLARTNQLDGNQEEKLYNIFSSLERKMNNIEAISDSEVKSAKMAKMQEYINKKVKGVLTNDQYKIYIDSLPK